MKKNLRVRQASALTRRSIDIEKWKAQKNPHPGYTPDGQLDHEAFEAMRKLKIARATADVVNLEAKLGIL